MSNRSIALPISGESNSNRNALEDEKYKKLADALLNEGFRVESVLYNNAKATQLEDELSRFRIILVWVNPIEQGGISKINIWIYQVV